MTCSSAVVRKTKTTEVHSNIIINVQLALTYYNGAVIDDVC